MVFGFWGGKGQAFLQLEPVLSIFNNDFADRFSCDFDGLIEEIKPIDTSFKSHGSDLGYRLPSPCDNDLFHGLDLP